MLNVNPKWALQKQNNNFQAESTGLTWKLGCFNFLGFILSRFANIGAPFEIIVWSISSDCTIESKGAASQCRDGMGTCNGDTQPAQGIILSTSTLVPLISVRGRSWGKQLVNKLRDVWGDCEVGRMSCTSSSLSAPRPRSYSTSVERPAVALTFLQALDVLKLGFMTARSSCKQTHIPREPSRTRKYLTLALSTTPEWRPGYLIGWL